MVNALLVALVGLFAGFLAAFFGIGGGVIFVPALIIIFALEPVNAVATSLFAIIFTSSSSVIAYTKERLIRYKDGLLFALSSIPGAFTGTYLTSILPGYYLKLIFSLFLFFTAYNIVKGKEKLRKKSVGQSDGKRRKIAIFAFFIAGFASGLLGIGGGILFVPVMVLLLDFEIHEAIATSSFMILITASAGVFEHMILGHVNILFGILIGVFGVIGAQIGAKVSIKTKSKILRILFAGLLIVSALRLMLV